jgi:hypothetical protein
LALCSAPRGHRRQRRPAHPPPACRHSVATVVGTSSGGPAFGVDDQWIVTDDGDDGGDPTMLHVINGGGDLEPSAVNAGGDGLFFHYDLTLDPGET